MEGKGRVIFVWALRVSCCVGRRRGVPGSELCASDALE